MIQKYTTLKYTFTFLIWLLGANILLLAQETFPTNGVQDKRVGYYAFTHVTLQVDYQTRLEDATLIIKNGKVVNAGKGLPVPAGAQEIDLKGKYIYPSFIDLYSQYGIEEAQRKRSNEIQIESNKDGAYAWNEAIKPEVNAETMFTVSSKKAEDLRKYGFGAVLTHQQDGIIRGTSTLVSLHEDKINEIMLKGRAATQFAFDKGVSNQTYPSSQMGYIALIKQTYLDADWYAKGGSKEEYNLSLEAFNQYKSLPAIFMVRNWMEILRADKVGDGFGQQYILYGGTDAYQRLTEIKATGASLILPVNYPNAFEVSDPLDARLIGLSDLKHWELAPSNAMQIAKSGINFAFTADGLKNMGDFLKNIRASVELGLDKNVALKALTFTPAQFINMSSELGDLQKGKIANFLITSGDIFEKETQIHENWVQGNRYVIQTLTEIDLRGQYQLNMDGNSSNTLMIEGELSKPSFTFIIGSDTLKGKGKQETELLSMSYTLKDDGGLVRLSGWKQGNNLQGKGEFADGKMFDWTATFQKAFEEKKKDEEDKKEDEKPVLGKVIYPFEAYGNESIPVSKTYLIKGATVWTNESEGILEETDVLIQNGKIAKIGKNLSTGNAEVIDGKGKHLTAGIIDEHSHIAISKGVNESGKASSAEVTIEDVVNSEDINIYRQLAGGVTTSQLLHGSANPVGGQSALIKLRWGKSAEEMKIKGADGYIKFALGENVKQSNWGEEYKIRFPQTRMGVEQVFVDAFTRARAYEKAKASGQLYRKDLELESLSEILNKKRFITCHSYVQSEINMLIEVANQFGFRVNTFTHILEGYKVADKMKEHGVGASTFSDWWGYKFEVKDAIPYNASLMHTVGVLTAINSDDAEMGRRLNQEAAKAVKYGGTSEEDALKMVTLNPAKLLHLDDRMGSIKVGKDADVVLWSDHPLSIYAIVDKTMIDGAIYFDQAQDAKKQAQIREERARLIQKMLDEGGSGSGDKQKPMRKEQRLWHCDDLGE